MPPENPGEPRALGPVAIVTAIQRFSIHDGPGIRSTIFFKGCPLRCPWCQNPEAIAPGLVLGFHARACLSCGDCTLACPAGAIEMVRKGLSINRKACLAKNGCHACVDACKGGALEIVGRSYTIDGLLDVVMRDEPYYATSGGGVTASGGEPTMQWNFVRAFFHACKDRGLSTAIQTCGMYDARITPDIVDACDIIMFDLKHLDAATHESLTGRSNVAVLRNLESLARATRARGTESSLIVRMPLVPGVNDDANHLAMMDGHLAGLGIDEIILLPYHDLWVEKLDRIGLPRPKSLPVPPGRDALAAVARCFARTRVSMG